MSGFPVRRPRRLRQNETLRAMVRETEININDLIYPFFVIHGQGIKNPVPSMPGVYQLSIDNLVKEAAGVVAAGIPAVLLFGIPAVKDEMGSGAYDPRGIVQEAVRALKGAYPELLVITDVCLCEYTSHGHCGLVDDGQVLNDPTLELIAKTALSHVEAGADIVAPSDMMDGRVGAIRRLLDKEGFTHTPILAYAAKFASAFYGPFREAAASAPRFGDRRSYQMDPANSDEALREVELDLQEGADMIMVKPALPYLDIIRRVKDTFNTPLVAYQVSGEYAMLKAAAANGWLDEERTVLESLTAIKRAGADLIITYYALDVARWLK
ncbi:MAG: porphobilinogen synthase [Moorella sp. (in: firmicutes)]|jgi:porphobilinogen synthase|uniref:porphobilinogen synthase n=1 Tax=unclassified Neomoorella TaxID=2676739 RepID=UPI0010FFBEF8|nr:MULTISPECIES: porphobilinogen synthase [unclassified Moorella (in: firmicutes)]MDK2816777.1 porphobilinogen synthase [Moorella sp. (in: firmicutes)]MDK2893977.1 porphobilinogen synthase [Moorella sp. (in: firmicutes)]GEA15668.1 delta-aminolevulinic acid dehydratase [Moorella sp. E308F]GEA19474.1 delta-aminolevulinic acid dehydratase [Moorella sp. E306M]